MVTLLFPTLLTLNYQDKMSLLHPRFEDSLLWARMSKAGGFFWNCFITALEPCIIYVQRSIVLSERNCPLELSNAIIRYPWIGIIIQVLDVLFDKGSNRVREILSFIILLIAFHFRLNFDVIIRPTLTYNRKFINTALTLHVISCKVLYQQSVESQCSWLEGTSCG